MKNNPSNLIIVLALFAGIVWLQVFLSSKKSKVLGLILPIISFLYSLVMVLSMLAFESMTAGGALGSMLAVFLIANIPTIILIAIYITSREKIKRNQELEKMNIQDLD